ncbi:MAG TPA: hypothetical protein VFV99_29835, partial [Kofleriaceae bacterium]|nr:hypothetical protein [Kofleriaceae bacterium]
MNNKLWILFLLGACGGGDGAGGLAVDVENPSAFCRAVAETGCSTMYACLTDAERMAKHLPMTEAECERQLESGCEDAVDSCNDNTHGYASDAAGACINEMQAATCNDAGEPWLDAPSCSNICAVTKGSFEVQWAFSPSYHSCSELGVTTVSVYSIAAGGRTYVDTYDCYTGSGITDVLPVGTYSVHLELFNASN